jgi:hypothetical protein
MAPLAVGANSEARPYLRCRLKAGQPEAAPVLETLALNASLAQQVYPTSSTFQIVPGVIPPAGQDPKVGEAGQLELSLDPQGRITSLAFASGEATAEGLILEYEAAEVAAPGRLTTTLNLVGWGSGAPGQRLVLPNAPIAHGQVKLWINHDGHLEQWQQRPDLDASRRLDGHYMVNSTTGVLQFGDGEQGRVVPVGAAILAAYETTQAAKGNIAAGTLWQLAPNDPLNEVILTVLPDELAGNLAVITNPVAGVGGADEETVNQAAGRLAEAFWAYERLVERCPSETCATLDQLERAAVLALAAPARATTLLDFERLALDVPGTQVARARAWAGMDPAYPCLKAPGTVTVVIVPELPRGRPQPSPGLLQTVRRYLGRRRVVGTRLLVVGPDYVTVSVQAQVRTQPGVRQERVREDLLKALNSFLDPLVGGPQGRGWPFGRDVYRSEIMQVIDQVPGVDHVLALELSADGGEAQCGNLCVGPTTLVTPGQHDIQLS